MLAWVPAKRPSANECLKHCYFGEIILYLTLKLVNFQSWVKLICIFQSEKAREKFEPTIRDDLITMEIYANQPH